MGLYFEGLVLDLILNKGFNFAISLESGKLHNLIERLHSSFIGFNRTCEPSFGKRVENSFMPAAL